MATASPAPDKDDDEILAEARARFKLAVEAEANNRKAALDDLKFLSGEQWTAEASKLRKGRPQLTINRLPQFVRQVVNEQRKTRPAIDVIAADNRAAKGTAEVLQGLVRHIERTSRAKIAYDTAFEYAVSCGIGHFRVSTQYCDEAGFDQEIVIDRIANPFSVYRDPAAKEPDHSDDRFTFVTDLMDPDDFEAEYGFAPSSLDDVGEGDGKEDWYEGEMVRVAEYWRAVHEDVEVHALASGRIIKGPIDDASRAQMALMGDGVVRSRVARERRIEQYLMTVDRIIKRAEWAGKYIPIITVIGGELNVGGKVMLTSMVRFAKDPARMYNYWASAETEVVALQPKAPWIAPEGSFDDHEAEWARANTENTAYLEYKPISGQPGPQRQFFPGVPQGIREGRMAAAEDIKAVIGVYDASLGARSNETSGVAIKARQQAGDTSTYHYIDNQARAIEQCGRVIIDLIPHVYDTPRAVRILGPADEQEMAVINQVFIDPTTGAEHLHDLSIGKYDVAVRVGPSFESKRQEMTQAMIELGHANPQLLQLTGDLIFKNMDWPDSEKIAERLVPPQFREGGQPPQEPPEVMAAKAQGQAILQAEQIKAQSTEARANIDAQATLRKAEIDAQATMHQVNIKAEAELKKEYIAQASKMMIEAASLQLEERKVALDAQQQMAEQQMAQLQGVAERVAGLDMGPVMERLEQVAKMASAERELVRDPKTGRAIGARLKAPR